MTEVDSEAVNQHHQQNCNSAALSSRAAPYADDTSGRSDTIYYENDALLNIYFIVRHESEKSHCVVKVLCLRAPSPTRFRSNIIRVGYPKITVTGEVWVLLAEDSACIVDENYAGKEICQE